MRFRANIEHIPTFYMSVLRKLFGAHDEKLPCNQELMVAVEKLQEKCMIKFTEDSMIIICQGDTANSNVQTWSTIKVTSLFSDYKIQSNSNNIISVKLSSSALLATLRSSSNIDAEFAIMKLAKKNGLAVLAFEVSGTGKEGKKMTVTHDVRIEVLRPSDVEKVEEPRCPAVDVQILLPNLTRLKAVADHMRGMHQHLYFRANNEGELSFTVRSDNLLVETEWKNCKHPENRNLPEDFDISRSYEVRVHTKSLLKFLNAMSLASTTIACICEHHCLIIYVFVGDPRDFGGLLTFYIPAVVDDE